MRLARQLVKGPPPAVSEEHLVKCELATEVLHFSGRLRLQVTGSSMLPTVWPGDTLLIERSHCKAVKRGDIVLFGRDRRLCVHRVVRCSGGSPDGAILTRGDARRAADAPVAEGQLLGRVSLIVRDGKCIEPRRDLRLSERAVAAVVQSSETAARIIVGMHGLLQRRPIQTA